MKALSAILLVLAATAPAFAADSCRVGSYCDLVKNTRSLATPNSGTDNTPCASDPGYGVRTSDGACVNLANDKPIGT